LWSVEAEESEEAAAGADILRYGRPGHLTVCGETPVGALWWAPSSAPPGGVLWQASSSAPWAASARLFSSSISSQQSFGARVSSRRSFGAWLSSPPPFSAWVSWPRTFFAQLFSQSFCDALSLPP